MFHATKVEACKNKTEVLASSSLLQLRGVAALLSPGRHYQNISTPNSAHHTLHTHLKTHDTLPDTSHTTTNMTHHKTHLIPALPLSPVTTSGLDYSGHQLGTDTKQEIRN